MSNDNQNDWKCIRMVSIIMLLKFVSNKLSSFLLKWDGVTQGQRSFALKRFWPFLLHNREGSGGQRSLISNNSCSFLLHNGMGSQRSKITLFSNCWSFLVIKWEDVTKGQRSFCWIMWVVNMVHAGCGCSIVLGIAGI